MAGKEISLTGELHMSSTGSHMTVDAVEALKVIGLAYGLYDHAEEFRGLRVSLQDGARPALVVQQDISLHGSPCWETIRTLTDDPEQIRRYMAFRETLKMVQNMDWEQEKGPARQGLCHHHASLKRKVRTPMSDEQNQYGKFTFYDPSDGNIDPLFTTKLQEDAQVGCLRGVFLGENVGDDVMVTWLQNSRKLDGPSFHRELHGLIDELRSRKILNSVPEMESFCQAHPEARMSDRHTFYVFRLDSSKYRYHLRLFPDKQKFYIFCYQTDRMREDRPTPDLNYLYRGRTKRRSGKEERE